MPSLNRVLLMGNLTRDPELRQTSNHPVCNFSMAVNEKYRTASGEDRERVVYVECTAWGKYPGEVIHKHFTKGKPIFIEGKLSLDQWEDKNTQQKRSKLFVTVESFQFVGDKRGPQQSDAAEPGEMYGNGGRGGSQTSMTPGESRKGARRGS